MARPGIEPRTSDLRVRCPTDCASNACGSAIALPELHSGELKIGRLIQILYLLVIENLLINL